LLGLDSRGGCLYAVLEQGLLQERDVFVEELLLQILGAGGDDDSLAGTNHRHQIS